MAWTVYYEDQTFSDVEPASLPDDGAQVLVEDDQAYWARDFYIRVAGEWKVSNLSRAEIIALFPDAVLIRGRKTSTRKFHEIQRAAGFWLDADPFPGWRKDLIGWRLWTETEEFDSVGVPEADWMSLWRSLPASGVQGVKLFENWKVGDEDYTETFAGRDRYYLVSGEHGPIFGNTGDEPAEIKLRYPGVDVKEGSLLPDSEFKLIGARIEGSLRL